MLSDTAKLYFPKIVFEKTALLSPSTAESKPISLYKLDWTRKEVKSSRSNPSYPELREDYDSLLKSLRFALPDSYIKEIRRSSRASVEEWNTLRLLDPTLKHIYLKPAAAYVETAFRLLSDCIFDESTQFYYRDKHKVILPFLLLFKFWRNQVTNDFLLTFSGIPELMAYSMKNQISDEKLIIINEFLTYVNQELGHNNQPTGNTNGTGN